MKKLLVILLSVFISTGCMHSTSKNVITESGNKKLTTVFITQKTTDFSKYFDDDSSFIYQPYFMDEQNIIVRRFSYESDPYIDEIYIFNKENDSIEKIIDNDEFQLNPIYYRDGTIYLSREKYLNDINLTELYEYKNGKLTMILSHQQFASSLIFFGMFEDQLTLIMKNRAENEEETLSLYNIENNTNKTIDFPHAEIINTTVFNNSIIFHDIDGVFMYENKDLSEHIETNQAITIKNDSLTIKGQLEPRYTDDYVTVEHEGLKRNIEQSYIVGTLQNNILIAETLNQFMFSEYLMYYDDLLSNPSGHQYSLTYFNGETIVTEDLLNENFFTGLDFAFIYNNTLVVYDSTGLVYEITIELR